MCACVFVHSLELWAHSSKGMLGGRSIMSPSPLLLPVSAVSYEDTGQSGKGETPWLALTGARMQMLGTPKSLLGPLASKQGSKWAGERPVYIHKPAD